MSWAARGCALAAFFIFVPPGFVPPALAQSACPPTPLMPVTETHTIPPYPPISQTTGEKGTTLVRVNIGTDGVPQSASVEQSSGSIRLDDAAVSYIQKVWRWKPPTRNCMPLLSTKLVSLDWDLRSASPSPFTHDFIAPPAAYPAAARRLHEEGVATVTVYLDKAGAVGQIDGISSTGFPDLDDATTTLLKSLRFTPAQLDGAPVETVLLMRVIWRLPPQSAPAGSPPPSGAKPTQPPSPGPEGLRP